MVGGSAAVDCTAATAAATGCLQSSDWTVFNNKLGTSTTLTAGQVVYASGNGTTVTGVATGTLTSTDVIALSSQLRALIGGAAQISTTPGTFGGLTRYTFPQDLLITGNSTTTNATTTNSFFALTNTGSTGRFNVVIATSTTATSTFAAAITVGAGQGTSTFGGGLSTVGAIDVKSTTATSTFANGIQLSGGCFYVNGACISAGAGSSAVGGTGAVQFANGTAFDGDNIKLNFTTGTGNLGVGTNTPQQKVHLYSNSTASYLRVQGVTDGDNVAALELWNNDAAPKKWQFAQAAAGGFIVNHNDGVSWTAPLSISGTDAITMHSNNVVWDAGGTSGSSYKIAQDGDDFLTIQRSGGTDDNFSLLSVDAPPGKPEATISARRIISASDYTFVDFTNEGYSTESQWGMRQGFSGTYGTATPFVIDYWDKNTLVKPKIMVGLPNGTISFGVSTSTTGTNGANSLIYTASSTATNLLTIDSATGTNRLTLKGTGNLGIGTTSPYSMLSVAGTGVFENLVATSTSATSTFGSAITVGAGQGTSTFANDVAVTGRLSITATSTGSKGWDLSGGCFSVNGTCLTSGSLPSVGGTGAVQYANGTAFAGNLKHFWDNTNEWLGIGTTTPWGRLSVQGEYGSQAKLFDVASSTNANGSATSSLFTILANGNVGIATTSPYTKLSVAGEIAGSFFTATTTTATSSLAGGLTVGTNRLVVDRSTNFVGIGTAAPSQQLEVAGLTYNNCVGTCLNMVSRGATSNYGGFQFATAGVSIWTLGQRNDSTEKFHFFNDASGVDFGVIDTTGNWGLGTTTPWGTLSIQGAAGSLSATSKPFISIASSTQKTLWGIDQWGAIQVGVQNTSITGDGNRCVGTSTLSSGLVTVSTGCVAAGDMIWIQRFGGVSGQAVNVNAAAAYTVKTITGGTSFVASSSLVTDSSVIMWKIEHPQF